MYIGLPALRAPGASVPDGRTIRGDRQIPPNFGTDPLIPVTNAIEALNAKLRRAVRTRSHFPSDEAALKLLYLVLNPAEREWRMPPREWGLSALLTSLRGIGQSPMARAQLAILFEDRFQIA